MTDFKALSEAATPGPWFEHDFSGATNSPIASDVTVSCSHPDHITVATMAGGFAGGPPQARKDAALIVALVNGYRDGSLVEASELEAVRAQRDELAEALKKLASNERLNPSPLNLYHDEMDMEIKTRVGIATAALVRMKFSRAFLAELDKGAGE